MKHPKGNPNQYLCLADDVFPRLVLLHVTTSTPLTGELLRLNQFGVRIQDQHRLQLMSQSCIASIQRHVHLVWSGSCQQPGYSNISLKRCTQKHFNCLLTHLNYSKNHFSFFSLKMVTCHLCRKSSGDIGHSALVGIQRERSQTTILPEKPACLEAAGKHQKQTKS